MILHKIFLIFLLRCTGLLSSDEFRTEFVLMRDGKKLAVDFYRSSTIEKLPAILEMTPYGRNLGFTFRGESEFWYRNGYIFVIADTRGTGDSEGDFEFFSEDGDDGFDLIEWIGKQPWSNGKVAMRGSSYSGTNQWYVAARKPKNLFCINPSATLGRPLDLPPYNNAFSLNWAFGWIAKSANLPNNSMKWINPDPSQWLKHRPLYTLDEFVTGRVLPLYRKFLQHPIIDSYWDLLVLKPDNYSQIDIPSLSFTGWFDGTMYGTIMHFKDISKHSPRKNDHFLIVGPYSHGNAPDGGLDFQTGKPIKHLGDLILEDNAFLPGLNMTKEFYDWCLKDGPRPSWKPAKVYITGTNAWREGSYFLTDNLEDKYLYLKSGNGAASIKGDGELDFDCPQYGSDSFEYNPDEPVKSDLSKNVVLPVDMNFYLNRSDFLVYTSQVVKQAFTIFGEVKLELTFSSSVRDTDFVAFLMDVDENNRSIKLGSKETFQLRTRYRYGFDKEVLMEPNKIYNLTIDMHEMGHTFLPGHRVRLAITSSFYPIISANLNTGNSIAFDMGPAIKCSQTIYHGMPSNGLTSRIHFKSNDLNKDCF
ncbi:X-Pro dipeptidyl-peptidase [Brachionus plicatilis]|uniref:X-Pro dipeptidyl-peptidase n=1 Tax=Brachionus plicatilis TaxID=10195 RepID=A0A3M7SP72_BRAPC|nr:X-Pro dipeptidyl-peptidase [Brachionus plicatilis]